jgi:hypothetical protein
VAPESGLGLAHGWGSGADTGDRGAAGEAEEVPEEEEEEKRSGGPRWNLRKSQGLHYKLNFSTDPKL